jgi:hypothetical protein
MRRRLRLESIDRLIEQPALMRASEVGNKRRKKAAKTVVQTGQVSQKRRGSSTIKVKEVRPDE